MTISQTGPSANIELGRYEFYDEETGIVFRLLAEIWKGEAIFRVVEKQPALNTHRCYYWEGRFNGPHRPAPFRLDRRDHDAPRAEYEKGVSDWLKDAEKMRYRKD